MASLLFLFANIENQAREIIDKAGATESLTNVFGVRRALQVWKNLLFKDREKRPEEALLAERLWSWIQEPLNVRNGICHGLAGASAEREDEPATLSWRDREGVRSRTFEKLQEMFVWLSKLPLAMDMISHAVGAKDPSKLRPFPMRDFWESEFGFLFDEISWGDGRGATTRPETANSLRFTVDRPTPTLR